MAIPFQSRGGSGFILRRDHSPDGTEIWLVCQQAENGPELGGASVGLPPEDDDVFPNPHRGLVEEKSLGTLTIDTTSLNGVMRFNLGQFTRQAARTLAGGTDVVVLDEKNASDWGLIINGRMRSM